MNNLIFIPELRRSIRADAITDIRLVDDNQKGLRIFIEAGDDILRFGMPHICDAKRIQELTELVNGGPKETAVDVALLEETFNAGWNHRLSVEHEDPVFPSFQEWLTSKGLSK